MTTFFRFVQVFALGTWVGAVIYLSFVVAPAAFGVIASRDQAGALVGLALGRLHILGCIAGAAYLLAAAGQARSLGAILKPAALAVILMLALTIFSQWGVTSRMAQLRMRMGSVDSTPRENPLRQEFDRLHRLSVRIEGTVLLAGLVALVLTVRNPAWAAASS
jgi:uncharacterized membrane protein